jgi:hypothetical protein
MMDAADGFPLYLSRSYSLFTRAIKLLQSQYPLVFSGTLVAEYLLGRTWESPCFLQTRAELKTAFQSEPLKTSTWERRVRQMSDMRTMTDHPMAIDRTHLLSGERSYSADYMTRAFLDEFYQCQVSQHDCKCSVPMGTSYLCMSPHCRKYLL